MKYRYEFNSNYFKKGFCSMCPLKFSEVVECVNDCLDYATKCVLGGNEKNCPLEEIEEDS